jgi:hypothetical protein
MGFPPPNEEEAYSFPAARKPDGGDAPPAPWESPPSLPLQPDHYGLNTGEPPTNLQYNPNMTGPDLDRPSQEWSSPFGDLSGPYGEPVPGAPLFPPPPPVTGVRLGKDDPSRRRRRMIAAIVSVLVVLLVPVGVFEYLSHATSSPTISAADKTATVAIKLDPPTPTLAPGQTPLPTPPATPTPSAPGVVQHYSTSATISITRKSQAVQNLPSSTLTVCNDVPCHSISDNSETASLTENAQQVAPHGTTLTLTVTNIGGISPGDSTGVSLQVQGGITCSLQGTVSVTAGTPVTQQCSTIPGKIFPLQSFTDNNITIGGTTFKYVGSVTQAQSDQTNDTYYQTPPGCPTSANISSLQSTVKNQLSAGLSKQLPSGAISYGASAITYGSVSCNPPDNSSSQQSSSFTVTVSIGSSSQSESYFLASDAINHQKNAVAADTGWALISAAGCGSPSINGTTINCAASGTEGIIMPTGSIAYNVKGLDVNTAKSYISGLNGVVSVSISGVSSGELLPQYPGQINVAVSP